MSIGQLQPADPRAVNVYMPYYPQPQKRQALPLAISLYQKGVLEGQRPIEGGESIPFAATWNISTLPADLTRCRVRFMGTGEDDLNYEIMLANFEFIDFLIDVVLTFKRTHAKTVDFSQTFYRRLLKYADD